MLIIRRRCVYSGQWILKRFILSRGGGGGGGGDDGVCFGPSFWHGVVAINIQPLSARDREGRLVGAQDDGKDATAASAVMLV